MSGPIKPKEVQSKKTSSIPEEVFEAFNELIVEQWNGSSSNFTLREVADLAVTKLKANEEYASITRQDLYDRKWLDVEPAFRKAGWKVNFDKPGYNENYDSNFTFSK